MIVRFDPYRDVRNLPGTNARREIALNYDAVRRDGQLELRFDLPGFSATDVEVTVDNNVLDISAVRSTEVGEDERLVTRGRWHGKASRTLRFGDDVDTSGVQGSFSDGVLTLTLTVTEPAAPRRIEISNGDKSEAIAA